MRSFSQIMNETSRTEQVCTWCDEMPTATWEYPFGEQTAVFKISGKIFALVGLDASPTYITLKAIPEDGEVLRSQYDFIREGYHMNKRHWITVDLVPDVPMPEVRELIEDSYRLVAPKSNK